ncbi:MAG: precorrin-6A reductase [Lachnospiraceae bacterium]|nr:precorrin-6A reductase [Lachnospiraceae bacterium]
MSEILIFAGTTEGREIAKFLSDRRVPCDVCVATEYGEQVMEHLPFVTLHQGRLDCGGMEELYQNCGTKLVIDATHPYASVVTKTILDSVTRTDISYLRLLRKAEEDFCYEQMSYYQDVSACVMALSQCEGNILLTTGSKDLSQFTKLEEVKKRIYARILPGMESLELAYGAGLSGKQILALQGPFSKDMNLAMLRQYHIAHLVTKDSGKEGGVDEKILAAKELGIRVHCIRRPKEGAQCTYSLEEVKEYLEHWYLAREGERMELTKEQEGIKRISLIGIGCGNPSLLTLEAKQCIEEADVVIGARRMLDSMRPYLRGSMRVAYIAKDIVKALMEEKGKIAILFSGDSGFYSGCFLASQGIQEAMEEGKIPPCKVEILPGISSLSYFSAKLGIPYQDALILSLHGTEPEVWRRKLEEGIASWKMGEESFHKIFFLTSSGEDVTNIQVALRELGMEEDAKVHVGYQLSYPEEEITCHPLKEDWIPHSTGLYVGMIVGRMKASCRDKGVLVPSLEDHQLLRDKVPMTKEEIRMISVSRLGVKKGDVVYDIGSGTGSISVQLGLLSSSLTIYAMEGKKEAVSLTKENVKKFGLTNVHVVEGMAPEAFADLPVADAAFIGGSRGKLGEILSALRSQNPHMRIVVNAVSLETMGKMQELLKTLPHKDLSISQVAVTGIRSLGEHQLLDANNPVWIYAFTLAG